MNSAAAAMPGSLAPTGFDRPLDDDASLQGFDDPHEPDPATLSTLEGEADAMPVAAAARAPSAAAPDDAQLAAWIGRVVEHDERALAALYDATFARLYALVLRITQRAALAEEVIEDTFWQVWRQAPRFDAERGRALTWLMSIAHSRAIDALRRDERFRHEPLPEDDTHDAPAEAALEPPDLLDATRSEHRLHQALAQLDAQPRQLLALAFFRGLTHEEIAAQTALPLGTVKSQIRRSLQALKTLLDVPAEGTSTLRTR